MIENNRIDRMVNELNERGLLYEYEAFLITPYFVQDIIFLTNNGDTETASKNIDIAEEVLELVSNKILLEDREYFLEIIFELRTSVISSMEDAFRNSNASHCTEDTIRD